MKKTFSVRTIILAGSLLLQLNTLCFQSRGAAGDVDLSFDPGSGVNGTVNAVVVQPDGKVIIGGQFTMVKGLMRTNVARLNADGSGDPTFNPGVAYYIVSSFALQSDGKVLVGGQSVQTVCDDSFGCWDVYYPIVTRLNANGSLDSSFNPVLAALGPADLDYYYPGVSSIVVQSDAKVLIGGYFSAVNGTNRNGIARLNANGSLDSTFNPGTFAQSAVNSVVMQSDGKVVIGGYFTNVNGNSIARLNSNGTLDSSFNSSIGTFGVVSSVTVQSDGKVLIGGTFSAVNGTNRNRIARLNADGSLDNSFDPGTGIGSVYPYPEIKSIAVQSDGKVLIGGSFTAVNGANHSGIARLNADGSLNSSFHPGTGTNTGVNSVVVQSDGKVLIGGDFTTVNGTNRNRMARLNADGTLDGSFHPGAVALSAVFSLALQPDGKVLVGNEWTAVAGWFTPPVGVFTFVNGTNRYGSVRLNADGSLESTFISSTHFNPNLAAFIHYEDCVDDPRYGCYQSAVPVAVQVQADGKVLIGGYVQTTITGDEYFAQTERSFLARFNTDGSPDTSFNPSPGSYSVASIALQPDGKVLIGGWGNFVNGTNRGGIARLNANGSLDHSFNPVGVARVSSVALQPDGKVLIGGPFTTVNGTNRGGIARLNANGSLDHSFNPGTGVGGAPNWDLAVAVQLDGKVLIGGNFTAVNGTNRNRIARLNANGSLDNSFNPSTGADGLVRSIALQPDGNVLIGGDFTTVNGVARPRVARLYGDSVAPSLSIARSNAFVILSWPMTGVNFQLQETTDLTLPNSWSPVAQAAVTNAGQISVTIPAAVGSRFFRLKSL